MSAFARLRASDGFSRLLAVSERLGREPLQVQGPGGNTSLKDGGAMWVKASGTWLAEARDKDIMVPVDAARLAGNLDADTPDTAFVPEDESRSALRPSIETSFHAALPHPCVLHTHCVATIATAIRVEAETLVAERLGALGAAFVPYIKPGRDLTRAILARTRPETRVIVLGNHGLIVCGADPDAALDLLLEVSARLEPAALPAPAPPDPAFAADLRGTGWQPAPPEAHAVARDPDLLAMADGATLYPDHLVFLGPGTAVARPGQSLAGAIAATGALRPARKILLVPGRGAAIPEDADAGAVALARALGDVLSRVVRGAPLIRLTAAQEADLLDWDAEKYRQSLTGAM